MDEKIKIVLSFNNKFHKQLVAYEQHFGKKSFRLLNRKQYSKKELAKLMGAIAVNGYKKGIESVIKIMQKDYEVEIVEGKS